MASRMQPLCAKCFQSSEQVCTFIAMAHFSSCAYLRHACETAFLRFLQELLDLDPLPVSALDNPAFQGLYRFSHFNAIQTQVGVNNLNVAVQGGLKSRHNLHCITVCFASLCL